MVQRALTCVGLALASTMMVLPVNAQTSTPAPPPPADEAMAYYDRHLIDVSNLRFFYEGSLMGDMMIHADAMFEARTKWTLTLYQMILAESGHYQARSARQLAHLGVALDDIQAVWAPGYVDRLDDERVQAAFRFIEAVGTLPTRVTAETHAMLRRHYTDRQIAELMEMAAFNAANAVHDNVLPIPTDQATLDWAGDNLVDVGWTPGPNLASSPEEQRADLFAGALLDQAYDDLVSNWQRDDLSAPAPSFDEDWVNEITGYGVSRVIFDGDQDGVEDPFDFYPVDSDRWEEPGLADRNLPSAETPAFDVAAYDYVFYEPPSSAPSDVPFSDRLYFDTIWTRQNDMGTNRIEEYFTGGDRALPMKFLWQVFTVYQLSSGCVHCQVHGSYSLFGTIQSEYPDGMIPASERADAMRPIYDLFDFERSDIFTDAELSAFRLARDAGPLPGRTTAAHIEDLRRHYADREIQELLMVLVAGGRLSAGQQANVTVTDRLSMSWALRNLTQIGWRAGPHIGRPQEQRRYFMSEIAMAGMAAAMSGQDFDFSSEWIGLTVPLAIDTDNDGVEDAYDGYPDDPTRWADTDRDGIEDMMDDDIDGDGLSNDLEAQAGTFPYKADSDGDGVVDPEELRIGTNPLDPASL